MCGEAQNGHDCLQKAVYTDTNGATQLPTVAAGQEGFRAVPCDIETVTGSRNHQ